MKALSFGEILWDVYPDERFIGGAPLNFAAHLARHGAEVCMLSAVGDDALGEETREAVRALGVGEQYISVAEGKPTGRCLVTLDEAGAPSYNLLHNVAYDYISLENVAEDFDLFYFGSLALRSEHNRRTVKNLLDTKTFGEVVVDVNVRPPFYSGETIRFCVENATILKISAEELPVVLDVLGIEQKGENADIGATIACSCDKLKLMLLTCGEKGAMAYDCVANQTFRCQGKKVTVASTVGAGDSFLAAFAYHYLRKKDIAACLDYATKLAAYVVTKPEAVPEYEI